MEVEIKNERPYECCNKPENMEVSFSGKDEELETQTCRVCRRNHRRLIVEKAEFKMMEAI